MNLEQVQEIPSRMIESGELFRDEEILQSLVDPEVADRMEIREWTVNKKALFISFARDIRNPAVGRTVRWMGKSSETAIQ